MDSENLQFDELCRICTRPSRNLKSLFANSELHGMTLVDKIRSCTQILIREQMDRPSKICNSCAIELDRTYEFHILVRSSETNFQKLVLSQQMTHITENIHSVEMVEVKLEEDNSSALTEQISLCEVRAIEPLNLKNEDLENNIATSNIIKNCGKGKNIEKIKKQQNQQPKCSKDVKPKVYECYKCKVQFPSFWKTSICLKQHDAEEKYKCTVCGSRFILCEEFNRHLCQGSSIQCSYCSETFFATAPLLEHLEHSHDEKTLFKCEKCGVFYSMLLLKQYHMAKHANDAGCRPFVCEICKKGFATRVSLRCHESIHSDEKRKKIEFIVFF